MLSLSPSTAYSYAVVSYLEGAGVDIAFETWRLLQDLKSGLRFPPGDANRGFLGQRRVKSQASK